jgi:hypothetical protein
MAEPINPTVQPPAAPPSTPATEVVVVETPPPGPKRRRRWIGWFIAIVVLVVLLIVGFFIAEAYAKDYAKGYVRDRIIEVLRLDPASEVDVDLGTGSIIVQALAGSIDEVTVDVAKLSFGDITGSAIITATGVPLDGTKPVNTLGIVAKVSEDNVRRIAGFLSGSQLKSIELADGVISIGTDFTVLGFFVIPVSVDLTPSATDGGINFDPTTVILAGEKISVDDLRNNAQVAALAGDLLKSQTFCVASSLPKALTITDVTVVGSTLVIGLNGDGAALSGPDLSELGSCKAK